MRRWLPFTVVVTGLALVAVQFLILLLYPALFLAIAFSQTFAMAWVVAFWCFVTMSMVGAGWALGEARIRKH